MRTPKGGTALRRGALREIAENIRRSGYHVYVVSGGQHPRWAYTIGLSERLGVELIFAGGVLYLERHLLQVFRRAAEVLPDPASQRTSFGVPFIGTFKLQAMHPSWPQELTLGARDYYQRKDLQFLQVVPTGEGRTSEVPDLTAPWVPEEQPVWRWLVEPWPYKVPADSYAVTEVNAFQGEPTTTVQRFADNEWEILVRERSAVPYRDVRMVALGVLLGIDQSLLPILEMPVGTGLWREPKVPQWNNWL